MMKLFKKNLSYVEFFELLLKNKFISNIWRYVLEMIDQNISDDLLDKQQLMNLFTIYFSLIDDGNTTISLDEKVLKSKWQKKIEAVSEMLMQHEETDLSQIDQIKQMSNICIDQQYLSKINEDDLVNVVKKEIITRLTDRLRYDSIDKVTIQINIVDIKSIYKPYWIGDYNGKEVFIDA